MQTTATLLLLLIALCSAQIALCQEAYRLPFASAGNMLELTVANGSSTPAAHVKVAVTNVPAWVHFTWSEQVLEQVEANGEATARFTFSIDKAAPVNCEQALTFTITLPTGERWTKQMRIVVAPPERYELFQNYPNPFNPTTTLGFTLPKSAHVRLVIYDALGREVKILTDENYPAGYAAVVWDGMNQRGVSVSSGVYLYRIETLQWTSMNKMVLIR